MNKSHVVFEGPVASRVLGTERVIRICLPESYDQSPLRRYPVLYVHDGQNAFSTVGDHVAFGWGNWRLDRTAHELARTNRMAEIIVVAVDCTKARYSEYRGPSASAAPGDWLSRPYAKAPKSEERFAQYSRYLVDELKPQIDRSYRTRPGPRHTAILGSSMGGVCSLALAWQAPAVFGNVASLSGAFQVERRRIIRMLRAHKGPPKPIRIYLDSGVTDDSGGDDGCRETETVATELLRIGWRKDADLTRFTDERPLTPRELADSGLSPEKWEEAQISQHNEFYWRRRAWRALTFLFPGA